MSDWDFLWGLTGQELIDAQSTGATYAEWDMIDEREGWRWNNSVEHIRNEAAESAGTLPKPAKKHHRKKRR